MIGAFSLIDVSAVAYGAPGGKVLARDLSIRIEAGELLLVTGANGSGKSTLLRVLLEQLKPLAGSVKLSVERSRIALLPQLQNTEFHLPLTLRDVLEISMKRPVAEAEIIALGLLDRDQLDLGWNSASGGERKRTLLTRLLLASPKLLLLDEPMNHLDQESRERVRCAIVDFLRDDRRAPRGVVLVSHEKRLLSDFQQVKTRHLHLGASDESAGSEEGDCL